MRALFPYKLYFQRLFCRRCQKVTDHGIYGREQYSTIGGMESRIPLLCCCDVCKTLFIAFSHDFNFCRYDLINQDYAKIYGVNRIVAGNWVYFKGAPKPALVKSIYQSPQKEVLVVSYDGGPEKKIEQPTVTINHEEAPGGYRLLPAQSGVTLMGDPIYHAIRHQFGVAVGLVNDGEKDKLVVLLNDKTLVFITRPPMAQNLPNEELCKTVRSKLAQVFPEHYNQVSVAAGQGIVFLRGLTPNLSIKRAMVRCVNGIPKVRGCVDFSRLQTAAYVTDGQIEKGIFALLEQPANRVFNYSVKVVDGKVELKGLCSEEFVPKDLETRIGEIPGVRDLNYNVTSLSSVENEALCKEIEADFALNSLLQGAKIRISCVDKRYLLEGCIHSAIQKQVAFLALLKRVKTTSCENRLRMT